MNIQATPPALSVREGFRAMDVEDAHDFFECLRQAEYSTIPSLQTEKDLTVMQARVRLLSELEQFVSTIQETKTR